MQHVPVIMTVCLFVALVAAFWRAGRPRLSPFGARLFGVLLALLGLLLALHLLIDEYDLLAASPYVKWYVYFTEGEYGLPPAYSALLFALVGFAAMTIALFGKPRAALHRLYWLLVALMFVFLALDEYFMLHERTSDLWIPIYAAVGAIFVLATLVLAYHRRTRWAVESALLLVGGLVLSASGSVILEKIQDQDCWGLMSDPLCLRFALVEESLENFGVLLVLSGVLIYARRAIGAREQVFARRLLVAGGLVSAAVLLAFPWLGGVLEARFLATPVLIAYPAQDITILGYRAAPPLAHGGDTLQIDIFWRAMSAVPEAYGLTVQLVRRADGQSAAATQVDFTKQDVSHQPFARAYDWMPGRVHVTPVVLALPPDIAAPASYLLTLTAWEDVQSAFAMLPVDTTDREQLTADMAVLGTYAVLPVGGEEVTQATDYDFQDGLQLAGFTLPQGVARGEPLALDFRWQASANLNRSLSQFVHLVSADGVRSFGHDQPLLSGLFPLASWPGSLEVVDGWDIALPADLPPGAYQVYSGLYDSQTLERLTVTSAGQPVPDNSLLLGTILLEGEP